MKRAAILAPVLAAFACAQTTGYDPAQPTHLTCPCDDGATCYDGAAKIASTRGETAATGEELMLYAQCACFQGTMGGCNTLGHFAKDAIAACDAGKDVKDTCTIAGYVYAHGVRIPSLNGRSVDHDAARARERFQRACQAGEPIACARSKP